MAAADEQHRGIQCSVTVMLSSANVVRFSQQMIMPLNEMVLQGYSVHCRLHNIAAGCRTKKGKTVRLQGVLRRGGKLLPYCFVSYLRVCK